MMIKLILCVLASTALVHTGEPPSSKQLQEDFLKWKFGMFIHFNLATYHEREWDNGYEDPLTFAPDKLDCNQWAAACKAAGMNYAVLTVKHTEGYGLPEYSVARLREVGEILAAEKRTE